MTTGHWLGATMIIAMAMVAAITSLVTNESFHSWYATFCLGFLVVNRIRNDVDGEQ